MNRLLISALAAAMLLMPISVKAASDPNSKAPPVSQSLVREGDLAVKLAATLKVSDTRNEAEAESALVKAGIAPKNGWVSDYPVTPAIMGQVQASVKTAAGAGKITLEAAEADRAVVGVGSELGVAVVAAEPGGATVTAEAYQPEDADVEEYYEDEGPPVVTYYAPPPDYYYLYDWNPWPFWWGGFWFPGFFVLADFDFIVVVNNFGGVVVVDPVAVSKGSVVISGNAKVLSNHVVDPVTNSVAKVNASGGVVSGASAWHGNAVKASSAPRPASLAGLSKSAFTSKINSAKGQGILSHGITHQATISHSTGTPSTGGGAVSGHKSAGTSSITHGGSATGTGGGVVSHGASGWQHEPSHGSMIRSYGGGGGSHSYGGSPKSYGSGGHSSGGGGGSKPSGGAGMGRNR